MDELLSLKWNNHKNSFIQQLSTLRTKNNYTDVTLACEGQLYNVHKMVLSACSDYFSSIFENISFPNPVIILTGMSATNLELLLDYMYIGEVNVRQGDLSSLIQVAECLKLKGLAALVGEIDNNMDNRKRSAEPSSSVRKRLKGLTTKESVSCDPSVKNDILDDPPVVQEPYASTPPELNKDGDAVAIKQEFNPAEYTDAWDFNPDIDHINCDPIESTDENASEHSDTSFSLNPANEGETSSEKSETQPSLSSRPVKWANKTAKPGSFGKNSCSYCSKVFHLPSDLKRHIRIHTGEKPFACPYCPHRANQKSSLNTHMVSGHNALARP